MPDTETSDLQTLLSGTSAEHMIQKKNPLGEQKDFSPVSQMAQQLSIGEQDVQENQHALQLMNQEMDDSQRVNMIHAGVTKIQAGMSQSDQEAQPWYQGIMDNVVQSAPGLADMGVKGLAGGAAGAGAGAVIGSVVPGAGTAVGAGVGWGWGLTSGMFYSGFEQSTGKSYRDLREVGVDHQTAKNVSYAVGVVNGALSTVGGKVLTSLAGKALTQAERNVIINATTSAFVKQLEKNVAGRMAMNVSVGTLEQTAIGTGTSIMEQAGKVAAGLLQKHDPESFTNFGSAMDAVGKAFMDSMTTGAVLSAGAHAAGHVAGKISGKTVTKLHQSDLKKLEGISPSEMLQKVHDHLEEQPNAWEGEESSVEHGASGEVYIRTKATKTGQLQMQDIAENPQSVIQEGLQAIYPQEKTVTKEEASADKQLRLALRHERPLNPTEVHGRLNQLTSDIKTLKKEERRLEAEITVKEGTGQSSHQLVDKWRNITAHIDALESQKKMLEEGLGTTETEGEKNIQLRMRALNRVFDNLEATAKRLQQTKEQLTQAQLKLPEIGFQKGKYAAEREIRKIQSSLLNIVNESTEDPKIRANVKQFVAKVTNANQAEIAIEKIKDGVMNQERAKAERLNEADRLKTFNAVAKLIAGKQVQLQGGHPVSKFPPEIVSKLQTLREFMKDKKVVNAYLQDVNDKYGTTEVGQLPDEVADTTQLASMAQALHQGDALSRNITAANIAQWVYDGKQIIAQKKAALQAAKEQTIFTSKQSLKVNPGQVKYMTGQVDKIKHGINDIGSRAFTWNTLWDLLSPDDKGHSISKLLDESESRHNYLRAVRETNLNLVKGIEGHMRNAGFTGDLIQKIWTDNNTDVSITSADKSGKPRVDKMTRAQMLDAVLKYKDPSLHTALREGNGFTLPGDVPEGTSTIERIGSVFTKADNAQLNALLDFYRDYHGSVNEVYKEKYGADLPMRDNYSPVSRKGYKVEAPYSQEGLQYYNLLPGSAKNRTDSKLPIQFNNPMQDALKHVSQWEYFKHYTDLLDRMGHVMTDTDIRTHIRDGYGAGTLKVLDDFHERFIKNSPVPSAPGDSWWAALRGDFSNAVMGFRANQFFTILPHGFNAWADYSIPDILHGVKETILHPKATDKALRESPVFEARTREGTNFELESAMHHSGLFANTIGKVFGVEPELEDQKVNSAIKRYMYAAHIGADVGIQRVFGAAVYHAELKNGASPVQALIAAERSIEQTQPGHSVSQTPYIQTNPIAHTILAQYTQHPSQVMGKSLVAVRDWARDKNDPKAWMKLGQKIGALWVIPGALTAVARVAPLLLPNDNQDEDQAKEAGYSIATSAISGPLESEPFIDDIVQSIWFHAAQPLIGVKESGAGSLGHGNFVSEIVDNTTSALRQWGKLEQMRNSASLEDIDKETEVKTKAELSTAKAASMLSGVPTQLTVGPISAVRQASKGDPLGSAMALGGWSPYMLSKRIPPTEQQALQKEEQRLRDSITGVEQPSVYDTMKEYIDGLLHDAPPPENTDKDNPHLKAFMEEASK